MSLLTDFDTRHSKPCRGTGHLLQCAALAHAYPAAMRRVPCRSVADALAVHHPAEIHGARQGAHGRLQGSDLDGPGDGWGPISPGRHCHSALSLTFIACHCFRIYTVVLPPFSVKMTASPRANAHASGLPKRAVDDPAFMLEFCRCGAVGRGHVSLLPELDTGHSKHSFQRRRGATARPLSAPMPHPKFARTLSHV